MNNLDVFSTLIAALCHDYKHNGYNNFFHMNSLSDIALDFNGMLKFIFFDRCECA